MTHQQQQEFDEHGRKEEHASGREPERENPRAKRPKAMSKSKTTSCSDPPARNSVTMKQFGPSVQAANIFTT